MIHFMKKYIYPFFKILVSVLLILLMGNRNRFIYISNPITQHVVNSICGLIGVFCILQIYLSAANIIKIHEAFVKTSSKAATSTTHKNFHIDEIIALVERNDIIDIRIIAHNKTISIGASSDCNVENSTFFNKLYYVNDEHFSTIDSFKVCLISISCDNLIKVISIDDILVG